MECPSCGLQVREEARACLSCGEILRKKVAPTERIQAVAGVPTWFALDTSRTPESVYGAGRLERILALFIDSLIVGLAMLLLIVALGGGTLSFEVNLGGESTADWRFIPVLALQAAYYIIFPATRWSATPGKKLLGLRIVDMDEQPISFFQSLVRVFFQQFWLWVGIPLALVGVSHSPWAGLIPCLAVIAVAVALWMLCANGRSPWDYMAGTKVVD